MHPTHSSHAGCQSQRHAGRLCLHVRRTIILCGGFTRALAAHSRGTRTQFVILWVHRRPIRNKRHPSRF